MANAPKAPTTSPHYIGRFAPSPTGPLHLGSLVAALASYLDARANQGSWLLRMEDLDPPREVPGAADHILRTLDRLGLHWDGAVLYQSSRLTAHEAALSELQEQGRTFPCTCSRRALARAYPGSGGPGDTNPGSVYPGTCRSKKPPADGERFAVRVRVDPMAITFHDPIQGECGQHLSREVGDFVVRRRDDLIAYQLAVIVDDAYQGVTSVVRGIDLLDSTPRQIFLQRLLGLPQPDYMHIPIVVDRAGRKLSKQTLARPIGDGMDAVWLEAGLRALGLEPPAPILEGPPDALLDWAVAHWAPERIRGRTHVAELALMAGIG